MILYLKCKQWQRLFEKRMGSNKKQITVTYLQLVKTVKGHCHCLSQHGVSLVPDTDKVIIVLSAERLQNYIAIIIVLRFPTNPVHSLLFLPKRRCCL